MGCTNITIIDAVPTVTISNVRFGSTNGEITGDCNNVSGEMIGKPIIVGFAFQGTGLFNILTATATYTDYLGAQVSVTKTAIVTALSGEATIPIGRNYHKGTYSNLKVTAKAAL